MSDPSAFEPTIALSRPPDLESDDASRAIAAPHIGLAGQSAPRMADETAILLRRRLRIVACVLAFGLALFLIRGFFIGGSGMQIIRCTVFVATAACIWATANSRALPLHRLRLVEAILFGAVALQLVSVQITQTLDAAAIRARMDILAVTMFCFIAWIFLVMMYGMFIPNTWRRALWFVVPGTLAPILLAIALRFQFPTVADATNVTSLLAASLMSVIAAVASLFGTHTVNALRREAFKARQFGQYRLTKLLGAGGMGEVHLAEHRMLKRPSAIKLIRPGIDMNPAMISRFEEEVQATATLSHWNTVEIFDYGTTDDGTFYYVMEYLPGMDLSQIVKSHGPLPPARALHFVRQVCAALEEAHGIGLIHRDVKPANIIAAQRGGLFDVAKLLDFGLARSVTMHDAQGRQQPTMAGGSPQFMSPEQSYGQAVDGRSDIYSLGATAYYLLTGRAPFLHDSLTKIIKAHRSEEPLSIRQINSQIPSDVAAIVMRCLEKEPGDRYSAVGELRGKLSECTCADDWTQTIAAAWWHANGGN